MQQTLTGCAFCDARPVPSGEAHTWGETSGSLTHLCRLCDPDGTGSDERNHYACDGCGLVVDALAALTRFRVELRSSRRPIAAVRAV